MTLTGGGVSLSGTTLSGSLGSATVTDARGLGAGAWTVTMTATDFTDTATPTPHMIVKTAASAYSGVATPTGVVVPVPTLVAAPVAIGSGGAILTATGVLGASSVTYNPTVSVAIPASAVASTYSGTITQTVS